MSDTDINDILDEMANTVMTAIQKAVKAGVPISRVDATMATLGYAPKSDEEAI